MSRLTLEYDGITVDLGYVEKFSNPYGKSVSTVPLCSFPSEAAFAIETGSFENITVNIARTNPKDPDDESDDMTRWSNSKWYLAVQAAADRWQMRTDGAILEYKPDKDNPYTPYRKVNGYIKSLTLRYDSNFNELIRGELQFYVGTMYVRNPRAKPDSGEEGTQIKKKDFKVMMSDSSQLSYYVLVSEADDVDCISSYTLTGGLESPFEIVKMIMLKDKLTSVAPQLLNDIIAGKNKVIINAVGSCHSMTVSDISLSGNRFTITAYADSSKICGAVIPIGMSLSARDWIEEILCTGNYGVAYEVGSTLHLAYVDTDVSSHVIEFAAGTGAWRILQICAMYLGCKVMFCEDEAYVVDCRALSDEFEVVEGPLPITDYESIDLYARGRSDPYYARVTGNIELGSEGVSTIVNVVNMTCRERFGETTTKTTPFSDEESVKAFGESTPEVLNISELLQNDSGELGTNQGEVFAKNFLEYRREPQQSITFTLKEMEKEGSAITWKSAFAPLTRVGAIVSQPDGYAVSNRSVLFSTIVPQKLMMSSFVRNYPQGTTTYTFGVITPVDLTSSTSTLGKNLG